MATGGCRAAGAPSLVWFQLCIGLVIRRIIFTLCYIMKFCFTSFSGCGLSFLYLIACISLYLIVVPPDFIMFLKISGRIIVQSACSLFTILYIIGGRPSFVDQLYGGCGNQHAECAVQAGHPCGELDSSSLVTVKPPHDTNI